MLGLFIDLRCALVWDNLCCDDEEIFIFMYKRWVLQLAETIEGKEHGMLFHLFKPTVPEHYVGQPKFPIDVGG